MNSTNLEFHKLHLNVLKYNLPVLQLLRHLVLGSWAGATLVEFCPLAPSFVRIQILKIKSGQQGLARAERKPGRYTCAWDTPSQAARSTFPCPTGSTGKAEEEGIGEVGFCF